MPLLLRGWLLILPGLLLGASGFAAGSHLEDWRSTESVQGLYEIDQAARAFVAAENARSNSNWTVAEPNLKTLVARCSVPLDARWGEIHLFAPDGRELTRKVVEVFCAKPVSGKSWMVPLRVLSAS
ncbi:hypothetical protein A6723_010240 [Pseudomonas sp. AU11447]|uniref:hypothetical protein n=1 Tax=unclassified Pseudomonas TaxID=196821 RepID=UPI0006D3EBC3|nr:MULTISPECIES: hypothetical protein [unclassified Pseudomonas]OBY89773.1 hypothetical protein A6723_010240 [Pseudomonas sp. AU11447]